jgi:hypothetical protein
MTAGDTGLPGSLNGLDSSSRTTDPQENRSAMSATTIYTTPYYPPSASFPPNSTAASQLYRRPSQHGVHGFVGQFQPVPASAPFVASDPPSASDTMARNNTATPLPPSASMQHYQPELSQPALRTNPTTPVSHTISEPHPRISILSTPVTPIHPPIQLDIVHHPVSDIVAMLASKLQKLITMSDRVKHSSSSSGTAFSTPSVTNKPDGRLLSFHARNIPSITITAYLNRILKYCPTDPEVFISVLVYFDRILRIASHQAQPIFGAYYPLYDTLPAPPLVNSPPLSTHLDDTFTINSFNVHRLVITTIAVATKFFSDQFYTNSRYARVLQSPSLC